jgi:CRISPR system Cascade subunit CasA
MQDVAVTNATHSYLGRLVPMPRFIRLLSNTEMLLGNGFDYPSFDEVAAEPSATVVVKRDGSERFLLGARLDRALWRQLSALGKLRQSERSTGGAVSLQNLRQSDPCDIWVGALLTNKATIIDTVESIFSLPPNFRLDENLNRYSTQVIYVEIVGKRLASAVETYRRNIDGAWESRLKLAGPKKNDVRNRLCSAALRDYWTAIEAHRDKLVQLALADPDGDEAIEKEWRAFVRSSARNSYRFVCAPQTARERRAFALGLRKLSAHVNPITEEADADGDSDDNDDKE